MRLKKMRNQRDEPQNGTAFTAANFVSDPTFDCNTATTVGDALATYLGHLADLGQFNHTNSA